MKKTLVIITSIVSLLFFFSCQKQDFTTSSSSAKATLSTQKFFTPSKSLNQRNTSILKYFENVNAKTEFVIETVGKIGYPRWDKIITTTSKSHGEARGLKDDSTVTSIIPFVREQDTTVNACIVVKTSPVDTSYYYLCDWQYGYIGEDNSSSYDQEKFAKFFMKLDKEVFDYEEFVITDTSLFGMYPHNAIRVKLNEPTTNLQEVCETTTIYYFVQCPYPNTNECRNGCDHCWACLDNIQWETCYSVEDEGGEAPPNCPPGTGGGGTGNGGGTTPPNCPGGFSTNNCGPGWTPANTTSILINSLNALLDPADEFSLDEPITPNNSLVFNTFAQFEEFYNSTIKNITEYDLGIASTPINQNEKWEHCGFRWSGTLSGNGVGFDLKFVKVGNIWKFQNELDTEGYGWAHPWAWSWVSGSQFVQNQNQAGTETTISFFGVSSDNVFIQGAGTLHTAKYKIEITFYNSTGVIKDIKVTKVIN